MYIGKKKNRFIILHLLHFTIFNLEMYHKIFIFSIRLQQLQFLGPTLS